MITTSNQLHEFYLRRSGDAVPLDLPQELKEKLIALGRLSIKTDNQYDSALLRICKEKHPLTGEWLEPTLEGYSVFLLLDEFRGGNVGESYISKIFYAVKHFYTVYGFVIHPGVEAVLMKAITGWKKCHHTESPKAGITRGQLYELSSDLLMAGQSSLAMGANFQWAFALRGQGVRHITRASIEISADRATVILRIPKLKQKPGSPLGQLEPHLCAPELRHVVLAHLKQIDRLIDQKRWKPHYYLFGEYNHTILNQFIHQAALRRGWEGADVLRYSGSHCLRIGSCQDAFSRGGLAAVKERSAQASDPVAGHYGQLTNEARIRAREESDVPSAPLPAYARASVVQAAPGVVAKQMVSKAPSGAQPTLSFEKAPNGTVMLKQSLPAMVAPPRR